MGIENPIRAHSRKKKRHDFIYMDISVLHLINKIILD